MNHLLTFVFIAYATTGYYRSTTDSSFSDTVILSDGREMTDTEFSALEDGSSQDRSACATCDCAYLNSGGKLVWAECSDSRRYICEYKGICLSYRINVPNVNMHPKYFP